MDNVARIVQMGVCTGCGLCGGCEHLLFEKGPLGFPVPKVDESCISCGTCVSKCIFAPLREDD